MNTSGESKVDDTQKQYLANMGIPMWQPRQQPFSCSNNAQWMRLKQQVSQCTQCALHKNRTQTVFGVGSLSADLMVVGEAPGYYEDKQGEPFVGRAGQLLNAMLQGIGLQREQVYIGNVLKCRPPDNRDPTPEEVAKCTPFLEQQLALMQPKLLLAVGRIAAHYLLGVTTPLAQLRGQRWQFGSQAIPLVVTYHPAYLLRNPHDKGKALIDLLLVRKILDTIG
jgi:uracil-DNA glycosylase